ncbi:acylphosphatase [Oceanispirochaeta crateris]|uniref:Acylphosphatase n=1 Tax=Oceanispirochaeta crateris TaxID=2518645 RepID=A0A5C1QMK8_9SPIO|nr:acylphosphatase [Oceanispirochaeta crateris]QEN08449.1 acylphosphatase [Oceanispirochaeta crateris]
MKNAVRVRVTGRVQGVGFRYFTCRHARRLGITGWVRNEYDGSVLVQMQGPSEVLEDMCRCLEKGPDYSDVEEVQSLQTSFDQTLVGFSLRS